MEKIYFMSEDGEELELEVVEETMLSGIKYLLVCEGEDDESEAYILKMVSEDEEDAVYEIVEDDVEFEAVAKLFEELVGDDTDLMF